jgi:hypothetical protein
VAEVLLTASGSLVALVTRAVLVTR